MDASWIADNSWVVWAILIAAVVLVVVGVVVIVNSSSEKRRLSGGKISSAEDIRRSADKYYEQSMRAVTDKLPAATAKYMRSMCASTGMCTAAEADQYVASKYKGPSSTLAGNATRLL